MNKSDYDKYYKKGGTYVIPVEIFNELFDELERLNNIIDELESNLYKEWLEWKDSDCESIYVRAFEDKAIYDYLQELKGDKSNETNK